MRNAFLSPAALQEPTRPCSTSRLITRTGHRRDRITH